MHHLFIRSISASAIGIGMALAVTPAAAQQCDPDVCANPWAPPQLGGLTEPFCLFDAVVWANPASRVYYSAGARRYGRTRHGGYMCEADAAAAGYRASRR